MDKQTKENPQTSQTWFRDISQIWLLKYYVKSALFADNRILIKCKINLIVYDKYTKIYEIIHLLPNLNILQLSADTMLLQIVEAW